MTVAKKGDGDDNDECGNNKKAVRGLKQAPVHPHTTLTFSYIYDMFQCVLCVHSGKCSCLGAKKCWERRNIVSSRGI